VVLPPWYKSVWFTICCIVVACIGIILAFFSLLRRKENKLKWAMKEHEQQVYEEKVRFLININHELRTPLTLIHAPLKQLLGTLSPEDEKYPVIQSISRQSGRMKKLLDMVLNVRKMEVGQSSLNIESVELNSWIEQLIADFRPEANMKGISISYTPDKDVDTLCFDKEKCSTILTNLLINALKYSDENSLIEVSASLSEDQTRVRISISDQGPGLKDVDINNLFIRFYQGNNSRPGTGIGLSYSKILAEQHGGSIGAYDHGDSPGSTFWFELPRDTQPGKVTLQPQPYLNELLAPTEELESIPDGKDGKEETQGNTLLIVDDNKDLTDYLSDALKNKFKKIWVAYDGEEALRICRESHPDIVVSDIQMPRMNGYKLCKHIKEDLEISHIPVILLTARNDEESKTFGYKNGADAYQTKPFEVDILYTIIQSQLKNRERMRMRYSGTEPLPQPQESTFSSADEIFLKRMNKTISDNLENPQMGVPLLCTELGISRASLYNKLKALTGMGANDYITKIRMEKAVWLLTHSSLSINEIADQTGFSTSRYFSTVFKQYMGCSPTQYKEEHS
jgi:DNA-binding response OmpR family regulator/nitrogen-specific signal transduction histidine kinase